MTQEDLKKICESSSWELIIWDDHCAYQINGKSQNGEFVNVCSFDNMIHKTITKDNCDEFRFVFSGEAQALIKYIGDRVMRDITARLNARY